MDFDTAKRAIDYYALRNRGRQLALQVGFYGGEPLLESRLIRQVVSYVRSVSGDTRPSFSLTTNGTISDRGCIHYLVEQSFAVAVSIDGPPMVHDRWRVDCAGAPTWHKAVCFLEAIRNLYGLRASSKVGLSITVASPADVFTLEDYLCSEKALRGVVVVGGLVDWSLATAVPDDACTAFPWIACIDRYCTSLLASGDPGPLIGALFDASFRRIHFRRVGAERGLVATGACIPGRRKLFVSWDGRYFPCERTTRDLAIGDVDQGVDTERAGGLIRALCDGRRTRCTSCWARRLCATCAAAPMPVVGTACDRVRRDIGALLGAYISMLEMDRAVWARRFARSRQSDAAGVEDE